jgi:FkbM family methyltransferase
MKKLIKKIFNKLFSPILHRLGYEQKIHSKIKIDPRTITSGDFYSVIIKMGLKPNHIVDIGANHGFWTRQLLSYFPNASYTLIEPQSWLKESFQDLLNSNKNIHFHPVGAGSQNGSFMFTLVEHDHSCTFLFSKEEAEQKGYKQVEIPITTLNDLLKDSALPIPDIIKIDAEGLDLEVLKGASNFLGKTEVFLVEAGVNNKLIPNNIADVIDFMFKNGYRLFEITDMIRPFNPKALWLVEIAFVKIGGVLDSYNIDLDFNWD